MLVLSRRIDEGIVIGEARVVILRIESGRVRVGIDAPRELIVMREELVDQEPEPTEDAA